MSYKPKETSITFPTWLHRQADEPFDSSCNNSSEKQSTSVLRINANNSPSGETDIPVKIKANNGKFVVTCAFIDPGSSASFCTPNLLNSTKNMPNVNLFVTTINLEKSMTCKTVNNFWNFRFKWN